MVPKMLQLIYDYCLKMWPLLPPAKDPRGEEAIMGGVASPGRGAHHQACGMWSRTEEVPPSISQRPLLGSLDEIVNPAHVSRQGAFYRRRFGSHSHNLAQTLKPGLWPSLTAAPQALIHQDRGKAGI